LRLLYDVRPDDTVSLANTGATVVVVAIVASVLPAARAVSIDPALALRSDEWQAGVRRFPGTTG
jgi:ABC-type lipoprotein release transport system permease subunit